MRNASTALSLVLVGAALAATSLHCSSPADANPTSQGVGPEGGGEDGGPGGDSAGGGDGGDSPPPAALVKGPVCPNPRFCWENPLPQGYDLRSIHGSAADDLWAAGEGGALLHWDGSAFSAASLAGAPSLRAVAVRSKTDALAVGDGGALFAWDGVTWKKLPPPADAPLLDFTHVVPVGTGNYWVAGNTHAPVSLPDGALVHVVGGVAKQALLGPDLTPGAFSALSATSPTDLWAVSSGHLYRSDGLTWRASTGPSGLLALAATSPTDVWGIASSGLTDQIMHFDGAIWSIAAGGIDLGSGATISARGADEVWIAGRELAHYQAKTWTHASRPSPTALPLSVFAAPGGATWVVGQAGLVAHGVGASLALDTKGPHWANTTGPYAGSYGGASRATTLFGSSASDLWVGGERVLHYDGAAWTDSGLVGGPWAAGFARAPNDAWLVNGDRGDVRHYDGAAWSYVGSVLPFGGQAMPPGDAIWASGPSDVWVADKGRNGQSGTFNHWNGSSWSTVTQGDCAFDFPRTVWGSGPDDVWFGSTRMVHVTNGGTTCTAFDVAAPSQVTFKSVSGRGPKDVYTTDGDSVYHYDGASWTQLPPTPEGGLRQVRSAGPTDLWALGAHGAFRFDGSAWTAVPGLETMTDLYGASSKDVWLAGPGGRVLRYTP